MKMGLSKLRRQIAWHAARLMYSREEAEYYQAKMKAARTIARGWIKPRDLPSNAEIRDELQALARMIEGSERGERLQQMRLAALRMLEILERFSPRLIGSVLTGHIRAGSDIDIHVFTNQLTGVTGALEREGLRYDVVQKQVRQAAGMRRFTHIHLRDVFEFELTVYPERKRNETMKSSITGRPIEYATLPQLRRLLEGSYPDLDLPAALQELDETPDPFAEFYALLLPLDNVRQNPVYHPEGDALYHSLQVFDLAQNALPYDEEFLVAALMHDVGKAIDPYRHVEASVEALQGLVTPRTLWLVEHHMLAHQIHDRTIGQRAHRRLLANESYDELVLLGECDRAGRKQGVAVPDLTEALETLRELAAQS